MKTPIGDEELRSIDPKTGKFAERRLKDARSAMNIYQRCLEGDSEASEKRAFTQLMFDGEPPYDEDDLAMAGQSARTNINFGDAEQALENAQSTYVDLLQSVETVCRGETKFGEPEIREELANEIFYEISRMIRGWSGYFTKFLLNSTYFISYGQSFAVFDDPWDWRFDVDRRGPIQFPKRTLACEEHLPIVFRRKVYEVYELWDKIEDEEAAETMGWNVPEVRKQILRATEDYTNQNEGDWQRWVEDIRNNDLHSLARSKSVVLIHCWVREKNGKVSHYIFANDATFDNKEELESRKGGFLYQKANCYNAMSEAVVSFVWGVGTNGFYDNIKGLGEKIYSKVQVLNRAHGSTVDGAVMSSSFLIQPKDEGSLSKVALSHMGMFSVLAPGYAVIERGMPNLSNNMFPVIDRMEEMIRRTGASYTAHDALPKNKDMTRFEVSARTEQSASLSITALVLFYEQFDKVIREIVRRVSRRDYAKGYPGGEAVAEMKQRLKDKGIDLEALYQIDLDTVKAVRAVGAGSASMRDMIYRELTDMAPGYDEIGRKRLLRKRTAAKLGTYAEANELIPPPERPRQPIDAKIAALENNDMIDGKTVEVLGNELHVTHLQIHGTKIQEILGQVESGEVEMTAIVEPLVQLHEHSVKHLELIAGDPVAEADAAFFRQMLQQSGEVIMNGLRMLEKQRREGGGEQQAQGQPDPEQMTKQVELQAKVQEADLRLQKLQTDIQINQAKLIMLQDKHRVDTAVKISEAETKRAIAEAQAVAKIRPAANPK